MGRETLRGTTRHKRVHWGEQHKRLGALKPWWDPLENSTQRWEALEHLGRQGRRTGQRLEIDDVQGSSNPSLSVLL